MIWKDLFFFFFLTMPFIKFRAIDKFEGFDQKSYLLGYYFEMQATEQENWVFCMGGKMKWKPNNS